MRAVLGLLGLSVLFFATYVQGYDSPVCTEGSVWYRECNRCWCMDGMAACTKMGCLGGSEVYFNQGRSACKDGSRWLKDDCNWCDCVDGVAVCTYRACLPDWALERGGNEVEEGPTGRSLSSAGTECKPTSDPADRWREGCNWCSCLESGVGKCTRRGCSEAIVQRLEGTKECEGHANWKMDCNWCNCDNGTASCTKMLCEEDGQPEVVLAVATRSGVVPAVVSAGPTTSDGDSSPSMGDSSDEPLCRDTGNMTDRWRQDCNWCRCLNGKGACTKRGCPPALRARLAGTKECEGNAEWRNDCNWCHCHDGIAGCTRRACINRADLTPVGLDPVSDPEPECVEGSSWTESCNSCGCSGGASICTRKACIRAEPDTCQEGALWRKDCNWCSCSEGVPVCTEKACLVSEPSHPQTPVSEPSLPSLGEEARCSIGSRWRKDDCNWCYCSESNGVCTSRACLGDAESDFENKLECTEGSSWSDGCNSCFCTNGRAVCGRKACISGSSRRGEAVAPDMNRPQVQDRPRGAAVAPDMNRPQVQDRPRTSGSGDAIAKSRVRMSVPVDDRDCVPGSRVMLDGCNWCSCHDGGSFACTLRACVRPRDPSLKICEEGSRWRNECNWCNCEEGRAVCTELACLSDEVQRPSSSGVGPAAPPQEAQCTEGSSWRDECNWCSCQNGGAACTQMGCLPGFESDEPECVAGSSWKHDCNWCQCNDRGISLCTLIACVPPRPDRTEPSQVVAVALGGRGRSSNADQLSGKECKPGSRFRLKCNWCTCSSEGFKLCSKKLCRPGADLSSEPQCEGDAVFLDEDNCNWCNCHNGIAACTLKFCFRRPVVQRARSLSVPAQQQQNTENAECVEGTSWMDECNRCRCRNGLKTCTRRICFSQTVAREDPEPQPDQDRCLLPVDSGPCYASFMVFRFNSDTNRCEAFLYGGCEGNDNRFDTPEECQQTCGGDAPVMDSSCDRTQCPESRQNSYMAVKGCTPVYEGGRCCASSYSCQEISVSPGPDQCLNQGVQYSLGDSVPVEDPCSRCRCSRDGKLDCLIVECPSLFRGPEPGCRPLYRPGECCNYGEDCSERDSLQSEISQTSDDAATTTIAPAGHTCEADGKSYLEGDRMFFKQHQCQTCVCGADYIGPYGPGCRALNCGYDFRYIDRIARGCVPVFYKQRCCPISFICPGDSQIAEDQNGSNPDGASDNVCSFADTVVAIGHQLATKEAKVTCTCNTPPDITCVQTEN